MIVIRVYGEPGPQGSKRSLGRGVMVESSKKVRPWREAVKWCVIDQCTGPNGIDHVSGPVGMEVTFTLHKPKSAKRNAKPDKYPDLSKIIRSTEDALTQVGVWEDDARVVECFSRKVFPGQHADALKVPGAVIRIWPHDEYTKDSWITEGFLDSSQR